MAMTRLDRFLANAGVGTRTEVKDQIRKGKVTVDGHCVKTPDYKFDSQAAEVAWDGQVISGGFVYYLLHKPAGFVTATQDARDPVVMDLLKGIPKKNLFPVGRLDKDTEGLLLITDDGALAHNLLSPRKHVPKTYFARIRGNVTEAEIRRFAEGLDIGDEKPALPAELKVLPDGDAQAGSGFPAPPGPGADSAVAAGAGAESGIPESQILVTVHEGRYHQVKRMFQAVGMEVLYLRRISMGPLVLPENLAKGAFRPLTDEEIRLLKG